MDASLYSFRVSIALLSGALEPLMTSPLSPGAFFVGDVGFFRSVSGSAFFQFEAGFKDTENNG